MYIRRNPKVLESVYIKILNINNIYLYILVVVNYMVSGTHLFAVVLSRVIIEWSVWPARIVLCVPRDGGCGCRTLTFYAHLRTHNNNNNFNIIINNY